MHNPIRKPMILVLAVVLLLVPVLLAGCQNPSGDRRDEAELVVYSARNERFVNELLDKFTEDSGIRVVALHGANPLQLVEERNNVQADIFLSNDMGALGYLHEQGILAASHPSGIESVPEAFRSEDNAYFALSARSRGFIFNKDLISEDEMPDSMEDLLDSRWANVPNGFAITRGGNGGMIGHISALRHEWGDDKTEAWVSAVKENAAGIYEGHGDIRRAVGAGDHSFGIVNNYYYHQQLLDPVDHNVGFIYPDQASDQMGVIVNAAGLGLVRNGPNETQAKVFLDWILLPENQVSFVGESLELLIQSGYDVPYPPEVAPHILLFDEMKIQDMPVRALGIYFEDTKALIERSGLDLELR